ncbi:ferredoxin reductase family protein [Angustibacter peucedani]
MALVVRGGRRPGTAGRGGAARRRAAPLLWALAVLAAAAAPVVVLARAGGAEPLTGVRVASLVTALVSVSLILLAALLPSRVRALTSHLGVERVLRSHRSLAVVATALVAVHVLLVLARPGGGLHVLDLRDAPPRVWAACTALLALVALVVLGLTRRRRGPRYEGWRLAHVLLANVLLVATALHVLWLHDLTRHPVARAWFGVLAVGVVLLSCHRWVWRPWRAARLRYVVEEVREEGPQTVTVVLRAKGHPGVPFRPGQFAWLKIGTSPFVFEEHPFTIASAATEPERKEFTIRALGDFSQVVAGLRPGRRVFLDGPHGAFTLDGLRSRGFVLVAGGVGVTPMLSMLRTMAARGDTRPVTLVVAGRTADDLLHRADGEHLRERLALDVVEVLEEPPEGWDGEVGRVTEAVLRAAVRHRRGQGGLDYFVCGPGPMVASVTRILASMGVRGRRVHTELFDVV